MYTDLKMMNLKLSIVIILLALAAHGAYAWQSDNGDGTFTNPVLYADYPDPDIIRVGEDFYMISTTFVNSPGITVLHSQDMVNWDIIGHAASTVDGGNAYNMVGGTAYRGGFWASSIRYHDGTFYIAVQPTFANGRIYYAADPAGPWNYYQLDRNIYDPGLFIDDDDTGYIISGHGPQSVMTLNSTYSAVVSQVNDVINSGGEGSHVVKRGSYYYLFNANPGVWPFQLRCSRATNIFGPWETGHICLLATTGGHQGAIVDIDDSDNWFGFVHQDSGSVGRMPRIGPVFWESNWPVFGTPSNRNVIASSYTKPIQGKPLMQPPTTDHFCSSTLGLQWQWNHNPDNSKWSLTERPGYLRLRSTQSDGFWTARNTLTQKGQGPWCRGEVKFDLQNLQPGDICGFGTLGKYSAHIAVNCDNDESLFLSMIVLQDTAGGIVTDTRVASVPIESDMILLRADLDFEDDTGICSYSFDGETWTPLGGEFPLAFDWATGTFQGEQFAIFCYNNNPGDGYVDVDSFIFTDSEVTPLYGDMNGDNIVNTADLSEFLCCWLLEDCGLDLNDDCVITLYEFAGFARNWLVDEGL
jgi:beta-xylosidase